MDDTIVVSLSVGQATKRTDRNVVTALTLNWNRKPLVYNSLMITGQEIGQGQLEMI